MIRLDHRQPIPDALRGAVVALGNFDGCHQGHQAVVGEALAWAKAEGRPAIIATFDPHPARLFNPEAAPFRLTTLDQRQELFAAAGADAMLVFHFDRAMAATSAQDWVAQVIAGHIGAACVVTGEDFTFGAGRQGNPALLQAVGAPLGLRARAVGAVCDAAGPISSSRIRASLQAGDCTESLWLMTRPFAVRGHVQPGAAQGRVLGYPTANLTIGNYLRPLYGIYAVTARVLTGPLAGGPDLLGAANFGIRPSFQPPIELLEPHFFDFAGNLYGAEIEVALHQFLRPEAKFASIEALSAQMAKDCEQARKLLNARR